MRKGFVILMLALLCVASAAADSTTQHRKKPVKKAEPAPPLYPSGPTGPIQHQMALDEIPAVPPQVSYKDGQLTIVAPNSTLADILRAVRKLTGAEIDVPPASERVVTNIGPGPAREVVAELLNGSRFNYVLLGSPADSSALVRVVLVAKSGPETGNSQAQPNQAANSPTPQIQQDTADSSDDQSDENPDETQQNAAEQEQPASTPAQQQTDQQQTIKTPQQILQEMQQRQMQLQQQQGQTPVPYQGAPQQPPPNQPPNQQ